MVVNKAVVTGWQKKKKQFVKNMIRVSSFEVNKKLKWMKKKNTKNCHTRCFDSAKMDFFKFVVIRCSIHFKLNGIFCVLKEKKKWHSILFFISSFAMLFLFKVVELTWPFIARNVQCIEINVYTKDSIIWFARQKTYVALVYCHIHVCHTEQVKLKQRAKEKKIIFFIV